MKRILGIETSCDETSAAVVENGVKVASNTVASSQDLHIETGGIIPERAARQQIKSIIPIINSALEKAKTSPSDIDAIAVTYGPGLIGSLLVGIETAKTISFIWNKPLIPVNHLIGHIYANFIQSTPEKSFSNESPEFPSIGLVVSGGHTDLVWTPRHEKVKWLGGTRDDAAGEAFDKTARLLGLPYPGGPSISKKAEKVKEVNESIRLPRPMIESNDFDFSFSGLKTATLRMVRDLKNKNKFNNSIVQQLSFEIQESITDVLVDKSIKAIKKYKPKSFLLAGGVAANKRLREKFQLEIQKQKIDVDFRVPPVNLCTDNASYIAAAAFYHYHPVSWQDISANPELTITNQN